MDRLDTTQAPRLGSRTNEIQQNHYTLSNTESQCRVVLSYLQTHGSITTLEARNELFIMGIAARIFELKAQGHNIVTHMIPFYHGCRRRIARYVLLGGV